MRTTRGTLRVFTYRQGILARAGHDLALELGRFEVHLADMRVQVGCELTSLSVLGAVEGGRIAEGALSPDQKADIATNLRERVLSVQRFPSCRFEGELAVEGARYLASGELLLRGQRRPLGIEAKLEAGKLVGQVELTPSQWGIAPFKALLGAIRLQDRVLVRFELPAPETWDAG